MLGRTILLLAGLWYCGTLTAGPLPAHDTEELAGTLRKMMLANLPDPVVEADMGWNTQREVAIGVKWEKVSRVRLKPMVMRDVKNDGHWQKVHIHATDPEKSLTLTVSNLRSLEVGKTLFDAQIGLDSKIVYEQQMWLGGKRLYAGESQARCRAELNCVVELTDKVEFKPGTLLPAVSFRVRVVEAQLSYTNLVCEQTFGLSGDAAKLVGKTLLEVLKKVQPHTEKDLLAKANTAIVKAADAKEVRIEFDKLLQGKPPVSRVPRQ